MHEIGTIIIDNGCCLLTLYMLTSVRLTILDTSFSMINTNEWNPGSTKYQTYDISQAVVTSGEMHVSFPVKLNAPGCKSHIHFALIYIHT